MAKTPYWVGRGECNGTKGREKEPGSAAARACEGAASGAHGGTDNDVIVGGALPGVIGCDSPIFQGFLALADHTL